MALLARRIAITRGKDLGLVGQFHLWTEEISRERRISRIQLHASPRRVVVCGKGGCVSLDGGE
jgi:hypothetical protein